MTSNANVGVKQSRVTNVATVFRMRISSLHSNDVPSDAHATVEPIGSRTKMMHSREVKLSIRLKPDRHTLCFGLL
jgi:hypothetical protein